MFSKKIQNEILFLPQFRNYPLYRREMVLARGKNKYVGVNEPIAVLKLNSVNIRKRLYDYLNRYSLRIHRYSDKS